MEKLGPVNMMNKIQKTLSVPVSLIFRAENLKISPQKFRPVADLVRKKEINDCLNVLNFLDRKGAKMLYKILQGLLKQVKQKTVQEDQKKAKFYISEIRIDQGVTRKKLNIRARGNADTLRQTASHLFLRVSSQQGNKNLK